MPAHPSTTHRGPTRSATRIARVTAVFLSTLALVLGLAPAAMAQSGSTRIDDFTFNVSVNAGGSDLRPGGHVRLDITATNVLSGWTNRRVLNTYGFTVPAGYSLRSSGGNDMNNVGTHGQSSYWGGQPGGFLNADRTVAAGDTRSGWLSFNIPANAQGGSTHQFGVRAHLGTGGNWKPTKSNVVRFTLAAVGTSTSMTVDPATVRVGEETTLSARVSSAAGSSNTPTGRVNFSVGGQNLSASVVSGVATTTTTFDTAGNFPVTASFQPTSATQWRTSSSTTGTVRVQTEATQTNLTLDPVEVVEGDKIVASATVNPAGAEGEIEFTTGEDTVRVPVEADGSASTELAASAAGPMTVTATFIPANSERYSTSSDSQTIDVSEQIATETALTVDTNPARVGEESTLTATVTPAAAEGTVTFTIDDQTYPVTVSGGTATLAHTFTTTGQHAVTADFAPTDTNRYTTSSGQVTVNVNTETTQTDLTLNPIEVTAGGEITATAQITPADATGQVRFDYADQTRTVPVTDGTAAATFTAEAAGTETVTATFLPTDPARYSESSDSQSIDVTTEATSTAVTVDTSPARVGEEVTLTATVNPAGAEGVVTFTIDGQTYPVDVSNGIATLEHTFTTSDQHVVVADFAPTNTDRYAPGSGQTTVAVESEATQTALTLDPVAVVAGGTVLASASVTPAGAEGTIEFTTGEDTVRVPVEADGSASTELIATSAGPLTVTATFIPTNTERYSTSSDSQMVEVTAEATGTAVTVNVDPARVGEESTLTATVTPAAAEGTVTFTIDDQTYPVTVSGGTATLAHTFTTTGQHAVTADFAPTDTNRYTTSSGQVTVNVNTETTQTDLTLNPIEVTAGGEITATAQITPADATGQVRFDYADQTRTVPVTGGTAAATFTAEAAGTETVTATFLPTDPARYSESSDSQTVDATAEATQTTLTLDPMSVVTDGTILTSARVTPAGVEGTIEFTTGEDTVRVPVAVDGTATTELTAGPAGPMTVTATFIPANAERYSGSSDSKTVDVFEQISTQTSITVDSGGIAVDDEVTLTATVTPSTASGTVTFTIGEQTYPVAVSDGIATLSHTFSTTGQHSIAAEFAPTDADRYTSSNDSLDVLVSEGTVDPASTTVSFDSVTSELGDAVTLTATVTPVDAAGDVVFTINGVKHTATVVGGVATLTHSADELGDHTVEVEFLPSDTEAYAPSTDAGTLTVVEDTGPGEGPDEPGAGSLGSLSLVTIIGSVVIGLGSAGSLGSVFS